MVGQEQREGREGILARTTGYVEIPCMWVADIGIGADAVDEMFGNAILSMSVRHTDASAENIKPKPWLKYPFGSR